MAQPSGTIYLMKNVPLLPSYEHTIDFKDKNEQHGFFMGFVAQTLERYTYIRKERESIAVEMTMNELDHFNYLMFRSEDDGRLYYAFIMNKTYLNPHTTTVFFEIDVFQTYMFDFKWNPSYISKAHVDRWTAEHKPIYSKTDEGFDYGDEYSVESGYRIEQDEELKWLLVSCVNYQGATNGASEHIPDPTLAGLVPSPFSLIFVPILIKTTANVQAGSVSVPTVYLRQRQPGSTEYTETQIFTYPYFVTTMLEGTMGQYVRSISLLSYNPLMTVTKQGSRLIASVKENYYFAFTTIKRDQIVYNFPVLYTARLDMFFDSQLLAETEWTTGIEGSIPTEKQWEEIKQKPYTTPRDKRFESKLLCAPYRYNLLTDWRNSPVIFKNEYMSPDKIRIKCKYALSNNAPFRYWLDGYKNDPEGRTNTLAQAMAIDFPILSDAYYTYMLNNKNTIQANLTNALMSAGTGIVSGAVSGGISGAVMAGVGGAVSVAQQQISENAKQKDLKARPDTVANSNDGSFNVYDNNTDICFYRMRICCENEAIIANMFHMYGYKVNRLETPNTRSRTRFNYIKTIGANITGSINQNDLLELKGIFDNGITIWHYHKQDFHYLDYQYENMEVNLI